MYIPKHSLTDSSLYQVTQKKKDFKWGPEQWQAFEKNQTGVSSCRRPWVTLDRSRHKKSALQHSQKECLYLEPLAEAPGETLGQSFGFLSPWYRGSEACYAPTKKKNTVVWAALEMICAEAQLLLAHCLPVLGCIFERKGSFYTSCSWFCTE